MVQASSSAVDSRSERRKEVAEREVLQRSSRAPRPLDCGAVTQHAESIRSPEGGSKWRAVAKCPGVLCGLCFRDQPH